MNRNYYFYIALLLLIIIVISGYVLISNEGIDAEEVRDFITDFGILAPVIYILLYVVLSLLTGTAVYMSVLAGAIFGVQKGWIIDLSAGVISSILAFNIARYFHGKFLRGKIEKQDKEKRLFKLVDYINKNAEKRGFRTMVFLRFSFIPYILLSYAAGLVKKLKQRDFILATLLTNTFASFVFVFLGASVVESIPLFILAFVLFLLLINLPVLFRIKKKL